MYSQHFRTSQRYVEPVNVSLLINKYIQFCNNRIEANRSNALKASTEKYHSQMALIQSRFHSEKITLYYPDILIQFITY